MLAMNSNSVSIAVRIAAPRVGDHAVHQAVRRERVLPRERLVDAQRLAVGVDEQIVGRMQASRAGAARAACSACAILPGRFARRRGRRIRRLVAEAAGRVDRAEQHQQQMQRAAGLEAVANARRGRASRGTRPAGRSSRRARGPARRSSDRQLDRLVERDVARSRARAAGSCRRGCRRFAATSRACIRRRVAFGEAAGTTGRRAAVGERVVADDQRRCRARVDAIRRRHPGEAGSRRFVAQAGRLRRDERRVPQRIPSHRARTTHRPPRLASRITRWGAFV